MAKFTRDYVRELDNAREARDYVRKAVECMQQVRDTGGMYRYWQANGLFPVVYHQLVELLGQCEAIILECEKDVKRWHDTKQKEVD
jgi:hypothetical protein